MRGKKYLRLTYRNRQNPSTNTQSCIFSASTAAASTAAAVAVADAASHSAATVTDALWTVKVA